ncbi:structural protein [Marinihelvus fidelis]|uniref:Structural protein n=1 Tax=Marinihelvus fidelis TaxID=2613842 RepID=A0A5N0TJH4_9GAMM|nr:structural protein [Marinihelvus fidelis]KAA9133469.1 structural protein [Marinihelvus fidelis]
MTAPRGIRNNNPMNIEAGADWHGLAADWERTPEQILENRFAVFHAPEWGIRAGVKVLITYQERHGLDTIREMIHRFAPHHENKSDRYAEFVAERVGVDPDESINIRDLDTARRMVEAMIEMENGYQPYDSVTLGRAFYLAGLA